VLLTSSLPFVSVFLSKHEIYTPKSLRHLCLTNLILPFLLFRFFETYYSHLFYPYRSFKVSMHSNDDVAN